MNNFATKEILFRPKSDVEALVSIKSDTDFEDLLKLLRNLILSGYNSRGQVTVI